MTVIWTVCRKVRTRSYCHALSAIIYKNVIRAPAKHLKYVHCNRISWLSSHSSLQLRNRHSACQKYRYPVDKSLSWYRDSKPICRRYHEVPPANDTWSPRRCLEVPEANQSLFTNVARYNHQTSIICVTARSLLPHQIVFWFQPVFWKKSIPYCARSTAATDHP